MSRSTNPLPFLARRHMDAVASERFPTPSVTSTLQLASAALLLALHTTRYRDSSPVLPPFSMLEAFTWPLDWSIQLFSIFIWHPRLSTLLIRDFVPPRHTRGTVPPPASSSLIDTVKSSQLVWNVPCDRPLVSYQSLFAFTDVGSKRSVFG